MCSYLKLKLKLKPISRHIITIFLVVLVTNNKRWENLITKKKRNITCLTTIQKWFIVFRSLSSSSFNTFQSSAFLFFKIFVGQIYSRNTNSFSYFCFFFLYFSFPLPIYFFSLLFFFYFYSSKFPISSIRKVLIKTARAFDR